MLIENGVDVNAVDTRDTSALCLASIYNKRAEYALLLLCFGAEIDKKTLERDKSGLLCPINDRLNLLRKGESMGTSLMSDEERRFMWNLAFCFIIAHRGAAFKAYYAIRSFITYHGIFIQWIQPRWIRFEEVERRKFS